MSSGFSSQNGMLPFAASLLSSVSAASSSSLPTMPKSERFSPTLSPPYNNGVAGQTLPSPQQQQPPSHAHMQAQAYAQAPLPPPPAMTSSTTAGTEQPGQASSSLHAATKKRGRTSVPGLPDHDELADDGDDEEAKARKRRLALSCSECKRRKIKCDRKQPCSSCIRRKIPHSCSWDDDQDTANSFALNSDVRHLARRLAHLESLFQATNPGLLPSTSRSNGGNSLTAALHASPADTYSPGSPPRRGLLDDMGDDARHPQSDSEDAAINTLEDVAFGARVPVLRALTAAGRSTSKGRRGGGQAAGAELTRALTSILAEPLSFDQDGRPRSAVRLGLDLAISTRELPGARSASMHQIFAVLPGKEIADFLIQKYFAEMDWDYKPLDAEAFVQEHERYREMLFEGRDDAIDPLWIANFCMVLALSLEGFWSRPGGAKNLTLFRGLNERELQDLPSVWHDAALRALQLGEWGGTPRIRTIQCVILMGQYIQIASSSGQSGRFLGWAASAIRVAQRMGLHRLGSNPETMPPDDPALPPGKNSLKRETCVRLFHMLVVMDSLLSDSPHFRCYLLHPSQYNTCLPLNLNYSDLSRTEWRTITPLPLSTLTDASFEICQCNLATQIRKALDSLVLGTLPFSYSRVLEQDREFRLVLETLPDMFSERCPPLDSVQLRYQRALLHESVYARIVRLHRPFLSRGYNPNSQFRYSTEQCVRAARLIITSNYDLLRITSSLWWMFTATLGSAIVLMMDLFHAIDADMPELAIKERKDVLVKASVIFSTQVASPALRAVVEQGRRILTGLFLAEESRRLAKAMAGSSGSEVEPFAHVLQRISKEVSDEEQQLASGYNPNEAFSTASSTNAYPTRPASRANLSIPPSGAYPQQSSQISNQQDVVEMEYWPDGLPAQPPQDFTSFFDTLASEDWTAAFASGSESGESSALLGQMQATW